MVKRHKILAALLTVSMVSGAVAPVALAAEDVQPVAETQEVVNVDISIDETTVDIPMTDVDNPETEVNETQNTVKGDAVGTTTQKGDLPKPDAETDEEYNYTESTVTEQSSVTVTTKEITSEQPLDETDTEVDMDYVSSDTSPTETNDLIKEKPSAAPDEYLNGAESGSKPTEGGDYEYVYVGTGNTSQFRPAVVFTGDAMTDEEKVEKWGNDAYFLYKYKDNASWKKLLPEGAQIVDKDEEGYALGPDGKRIVRREMYAIGPDGTKYYLDRIDALGTGHNVEGWYQDGEWVAELNGKDKFASVYSVAQQYVLVDKETGEISTTYCADISTFTEKGFGYSVENLQDADYYTEEQAEMIRSIALQGYWGTESGEGSLAEMKKNLLASGNFTEDELNSLTDGVALTATQMAIWSFSNYMDGAEFVNSHYIELPSATETNVTGLGNKTYPDPKGSVNVPTDKEDEVKLMFKIYEYLKNLDPTKTENKSNDTIYNADNFLKDMSLTVVEKDKSHKNNKDDDTTNDAYVTNLTFALVVEPVEGNGDDLVVTVITSSGKEIKGRIAGTKQDGEIQLVKKGDNYTFEGITLVEGDQIFNISLTGIQNLKEGVYLYSSEVRDGETSQTLVGMANGSHAVNVNMNIVFELNVDDEVVVTERIRKRSQNRFEEFEEERSNGGGSNNYVTYRTRRRATTDGLLTINDEAVPLAASPNDGFIEIVDEEVPLADVPKTGYGTLGWLMLSSMSGIGLVGLHLTERKKEEEE